MRRVRYYLGGALFWGAFVAVCVLLFWNAQRLARAAGGHFPAVRRSAGAARCGFGAGVCPGDGRNECGLVAHILGCAAGSGLCQRAGGDRPDAAGVRRCRTSGNGASFIRCAARPGRPGRMRGIQRAGLAALGSAGCEGQGLELELDGERYTVRGVFESGEARAVTQEAGGQPHCRVRQCGTDGDGETAPEGTEAALAFAGASGLGTPAHVVDGPALAGLACALCWLPLALCGACTLWRLARGARRLSAVAAADAAVRCAAVFRGAAARAAGNGAGGPGCPRAGAISAFGRRWAKARQRGWTRGSLCRPSTRT